MIELPSLRPHQEEFRDRLRAALATHGRVIACAQAGFGKTRCAKWILGTAANRVPGPKQSGRSLFAVYSRGLVDNASDSFNEEPAVPHGVLMAGRETSYGRRIQIGSIDTMLSYFIEEGCYATDLTFDVLIYDEADAHHTKFARFLKYHDEQREKMGLNPAYVIGLTATPKAKGLADVYKDIVLGPSTEFLTVNGFLAPFRYFCGTLGKLGLLVKRGDKFTEESEAAAFQDMAGDLVRDWKKFAEGRPTVGFFPRRQHAKDAMVKLSEAGLRVDYVDGDTPDEERNRIFRALTRHDLDYVANCRVIGRGTDLPIIGCVQLCVALGSVAAFRQMVGRGSRVHPEKTDCLVIDHGNNVRRHGFFIDDPLWQLDISEKDPGDQGARPTIECPKCCLARGTMVLTDRGEVPIQDVKITDRVWDGVEFCCHGGTRCNGTREVIEWGGLILTPDHKVLTHGGGWKEAAAAKADGWWPVSGGIGGTPIRTTDDSNPYYPVSEQTLGGRSRLLPVWETGMAIFPQDVTSSAAWLRALHVDVRRGLPGMARATSQPAEVALPMPTTYRLQQLRRSRDRVSVCFDSGWRSLDCEASWASAQQIMDHRSHRQQRSLRTRQYSLGDDADTREQSEAHLEAAIPSTVSICDVWRESTIETRESRVYSEADSRPMDRKVRNTRNGYVASEAEEGPSIRKIQQTPTDLHDAKGNDSEANRRSMVAEVWDILDAGPRNRYCANGVIVSNCRIYRGGRCVCGYEPTQKERKAQGVTFDGSELREVKREEKPETTVKTAEQLMVSAMYRAGKSGKTWSACFAIFKKACEENGTPQYRVPKTVTIAGHRYKCLRYDSDDKHRRVAHLFPIVVSGKHGGDYLVQEQTSAEVQW